MEKNTFKFIFFLFFILFSVFSKAQGTAPDEDTGTYTTCNPDGANATRTSNDLPNPVNVGTIDDRSCYANYKESFVNGKTWGVYNITDGSNEFDTTLQPRIERSLSRSSETGVGSYAKFTGTVRILEVGDTSGTNSDGSYIMQAKGKHTGGGGSNDPAICLYLAKPVYGIGVDADKQVSFDIYAERILERGGEGSGREVVFLKNVLKNVETSIVLEVGFREDPNDATKKIHYCDAVIGGDSFNYNIPDPERGVESGIRYGAYRVKGGRAQIRWANTTYQKEEVVDNNIAEPADDIYRLRNVATGEFLTDAGVGASPVSMTAAGEAQNTHWTFVKSGEYYNIDSETYGIIRTIGSTGAVVSTSKAAPAADTDKTWTLHQDETTKFYRFEIRNNNKFMYHNVDGTVTSISADQTDQRSQWEAIPTSQSLSIEENELVLSSIKIYPNPANNIFNILLNNISGADVKIYDTLGKVVYKESSANGKIEIRNNRELIPGLYIVTVITKDKKVYHSKLIKR